MNKRVVILADNSYTIRRIAELSFSEEEDIKLVTFETGEGFKEKLIELKPSIVLVDIKFPDFNGYEVCKFINEEASLKDTKVFLIRGGFEAIDDEKIKGLDYIDIITKPFDSTALVDTIKSNLGMGRTDTLGEDELADGMPEELPEISEMGSPEEDISFSDIQDEIESEALDFGDDKDDSRDEFRDEVEPSEEITVQQHEGQDRLKPEEKELMDNPFEKDESDSDDVDFAGVADELKKLRKEPEKEEVSVEGEKEGLAPDEEEESLSDSEPDTDEISRKDEDTDEKSDLQIDPSVLEDIDVDEEDKDDTFDAEDEIESAIDEPKKEEDLMPGDIGIGDDQEDEEAEMKTVKTPVSPQIEEPSIGDLDIPSSLDDIIEDEKEKEAPQSEEEGPESLEDDIEFEESDDVSISSDQPEKEDSQEDLEIIDSIKQLEQIQKDGAHLDEAGDFGIRPEAEAAPEEELEIPDEEVAAESPAVKLEEEQPPAGRKTEDSDVVFNKDVIVKKIEDKLEIAVKEILWEIIPPMAEKIITAEIEKIKAQVSEDTSE